MGYATPHRTDREPLSVSLETLSRQLAARAAHYDASGEFPAENFALLQQHDLLALALPARLGGGGCTLATALTVVSAVAEGDPSTALILVMQYLHTHRLDSYGWPLALQQQVAADVVGQGALINALRVEPDLGTPARGGIPATRAQRVGEAWSLSGEKIYSTGSSGLGWMLVWAAGPDEAERGHYYLVPASAAGIRIIPDWDHLGMRATCSHKVVFDNVRIPLSHAAAAGTPDRAGEQESQRWMAVLLPAVYDAIARCAQRWLVQFLQQRVPSALQAPLATLPRFQDRIGQTDTLLFSNQVLLTQAAAGTFDAARAGQIKYLVCRQAIRVVELAIEAAGNPGLSRQHELQRHLRNVLCARIHTPQDDAVLGAAGRRVLGL